MRYHRKKERCEEPILSLIPDIWDHFVPFMSRDLESSLTLRLVDMRTFMRLEDKVLSGKKFVIRYYCRSSPWTANLEDVSPFLPVQKRSHLNVPYHLMNSKEYVSLDLVTFTLGDKLVDNWFIMLGDKVIRPLPLRKVFSHSLDVISTICKSFNVSDRWVTLLGDLLETLNTSEISMLQHIKSSISHLGGRCTKQLSPQDLNPSSSANTHLSDLVLAIFIANIQNISSFPLLFVWKGPDTFALHIFVKKTVHITRFSSHLKGQRSYLLDDKMGNTTSKVKVRSLGLYKTCFCGRSSGL